MLLNGIFDSVFLCYRKFLDHQYVVGFSKNREAIVATVAVRQTFFVEEVYHVYITGE